MQKRIAFLMCTLLTLTVFAAAQRPSPAANAQCKFADGKNIKVDYSSPRAKGRQSTGGLVPYGQVWRTGANEATTFVTDANLSIGGKDTRPAATRSSPSPTKTNGRSSSTRRTPSGESPTNTKPMNLAVST